MPEPLKNSYNPQYIAKLSDALEPHQRGFEHKAFAASVFDADWPARELKARMSHIRECLHRHINLPFEQALDVLLPAARDFGGYEAMFFPEYIEVYGQEHWQLSMDALALLTQYSSSEFAVRPFIEQDSERMMAQMLRWAGHESHHVRRLASEGCRPRLPWAGALPAFKRDPAALLPILTQLRTDDSLYVRRSVANNLNDIAKDNPQVVMHWAQQHHGQNPLTDWVIKHACRSLLKRAHPQALALFGFGDVSFIAVSDLKLDTNKASIGGELAFVFQLSGQKTALGRLRIEYAIDYMKANGRLARKLFKIAEGDYNQTQVEFQRRQSFRPMSTRKHYPGLHRLAVVVNGVELASREFDLLA